MQGLRFYGDPAFLMAKKNVATSMGLQNKGNKQDLSLLFSAGESIIRNKQKICCEMKSFGNNGRKL